mmetsp:Transcript_7459/g.19146  ORF Transcript_7459/g.19146 Transcript_7459/m.19146 type:complete len:359 (+) Transcript_7459:211-1287(+)|eukprot:jgi/Tetstr1/432217/TSEL_021673.t1
METRRARSAAAPWFAAAWTLLLLASAVCYREIPAENSFTARSRSLLTEDGGEIVEIEEGLFELVTNLPEATEVTPIFVNETSAEQFSQTIVLNPDEDTETRVINGDPLPDSDRFPYVVRLESQRSSRGTVFLCGGTLISRNVILTAAHCRNMAYAYIQDGRGRYEKHSISEDVTHPFYFNNIVPEYDFQLLRLRGSTRQRTVELDDGSATNGLDDQPVLTILGWGLTSCDNFDGRLNAAQRCQGATRVQDIRWAYVAFLQSTRCFPQYPNLITRSMLCAEDFVGDARQQDACQGDSGGPLIMHSGAPSNVPWGSISSDRQVGVVSWGFGCAKQGQPGVYGRIATVYPWIMDRMKESRW